MTDIIHSFKCDLGHSMRWAVPHSHILHQNTAPPWKGVEFTLHTVSAGKWLQDKTYDCSISDSAAQEFVKITGKRGCHLSKTNTVHTTIPHCGE